MLTLIYLLIRKLEHLSYAASNEKTRDEEQTLGLD